MNNAKNNEDISWAEFQELGYVQQMDIIRKKWSWDLPLKRNDCFWSYTAKQRYFIYMTGEEPDPTTEQRNENNEREIRERATADLQSRCPHTNYQVLMGSYQLKQEDRALYKCLTCGHTWLGWE